MAIKSFHSKDYRLAVGLLREARVKAGLTQQALADALARPQSYVAKYESGERRLDIIEFIGIARALKVRASSIVAKLERAK